MKVFISHNKADKPTARLLAMLLVEQGINVWFDEWMLRPGDSITGGIENGLSDSDTFVLFWSSEASQSKWVGTEVRAYLRLRVDDDTLQIIPIMLDDTPLPTLVADYRGYRVNSDAELNMIAAEISGPSADIDITARLQQRLFELAEKHREPENPHRYIVCPQCGSQRLTRNSFYSDVDKSNIYSIICDECNWGVIGPAKRH